jgi:hypothetical protein
VVIIAEIRATLHLFDLTITYSIFSCCFILMWFFVFLVNINVDFLICLVFVSYVYLHFAAKGGVHVIYKKARILA